MKKAHSSFKNLFEKGFKLGVSNIWRNKILSLATVFVIGIIIFVFNVILAINYVAQEALDDLNQKIDISIYLKESASYENIDKILKDLNQIEAVLETNYISKEDALEQMKTLHPNLKKTIDKYGNPLPASINIITKNPEDHQLVVTYLDQDKYQKHITEINANIAEKRSPVIDSVSRNLVSLNQFANKIIFWLIIIFLIGGTLIIFNAVQITIFNRRKEIQVMKLVGASHWFIKLPFIIESIIYGLLAVILSFFMLKFVAEKIQIQNSSLEVYYSSLEFGKIFALEILATSALAILSSLIAVHNYLHRHHK